MFLSHDYSILIVNKEILEDIGLTKSEISVYLALLELGSCSTGKIVDKSGTASSKIYEVLDKLMQKGLASYIIKQGVKYFEAAPPERILDYVKEKEKRLMEQKRGLKGLIPQLRIRQELAKRRNEAQIFKGIKGGETAFKMLLDKMQPEDEWVAFVVSYDNERYFNKITGLHRLRARMGIRARIIFAEKHRVTATKERDLPNTQIRFLPDSFQTPSIINVAGDVVLINIMGDDVTVFMIENREVANSFRNQFEVLWNRETTVVKGLDAIQSIFEEMLYYDSVDLIGASGYFVDERPDFIKVWKRRAMAKGFTMRNIVDESVRGHAITRFPFAKTKYTLPKAFSNLSVFWIFGEKVVISNWAAEEPIAVIINNKQINDMYQKQFEVLWG